MRQLRTLLLAAALLTLLPASALAAGNGAAAVQDCQDGRIDGTYSAADYSAALKSIPTDVDEYTDCRDVLRAAQLRAARTPTKPGAPASSAPAASAPGSTAGAAGTAPAASPGEVAASGGASPGVDPAAATSPPPGSGKPTTTLAPAGTAPPPTIPGLPVDTGPATAGGTQGARPLSTAAASRVTEEVPPTLAFLLVLTAAGLLTVGALRARRSHRVAD